MIDEVEVALVGANGRATAGFALPAGLPSDLVGLRLHPAFLTVDPATFAITHVSNPVPLDLR